MPGAAAAVLALAPAAAAAGIETIAAYKGAWQIEIENYKTAFSEAGKESTSLQNDCWSSAGFYACDQIVNGKSSALLVFTYDEKTDMYGTYAIPAGGGNANHGTLLIRGNVWTYPWEQTENGHTTYFRVVNVFTAPDTIEFRREFSTDKQHWTAMAKGIEKKQK